MSDKFYPAPLDLLTRWIFGELAERGSIFGIPRVLFFKPQANQPYRTSFYGQALETPLGVAAGPHTQLAQNIVVAYLLGARFIELKTVQTLDELDVSKPCIDVEDAGYNCEWSQELTLKESADEYIKAWVLIHALREKLGFRDDSETGASGPGFIFNLSVGYNLAGIQKPNVQRFLATMRDASAVVPAQKEIVARHCPEVNAATIPSRLSDNITLSTMHGCPPEEIEQIGTYLLGDLGVHTAIKMNPTLLGKEALRGILNSQLGFSDIMVPDEAFAHDTKYPDAIAMIKRLDAQAKTSGLTFGLKLTNTLEVENHRDVFPAKESMMYMSGRALHPLTINIAARLRQDLGPLPMSFSGGADAFNLPDILAGGLRPVTVCTDLLKPGGYTRLPQYLERLGDAMASEDAETLDAWSCRHAGLPDDESNVDEAQLANLRRYAELVAGDTRYRKLPHQPQAKGTTPLAWFDCVEAPCRDGCPANQNIPEYLNLVATGRHEEALAVIRETNALPHITGAVCDHPCEIRCVRSHYDAPLAIRGIKRFVAEHVSQQAHENEESIKRSDATTAPKVAIVGGGPAGLSAAYYLARAGSKVTLFEAHDRLGGTVSATIPRFRLDLDDILADTMLLEKLGVKIHYHQRLGRDLSLAELRAQGHDAVILATGANLGKQLGVAGEDAAGVHDGYGFLSLVRDDEKLPLGQHTVIVGGGNAAMD
ncbi:MAG: FAD-dependent oxidoreductase, partial [Deltaproteobacteria bacterium]|nr:FAD-dependent oxidoreductase [Deltaproteobacteria bacterium]